MAHRGRAGVVAGLWFSLSSLTACSGPAPEPKSGFTIGGSINYLRADGLVLAVTGQPNLAVPAGTTRFAFANNMAGQAYFSVHIAAQPLPAQRCKVTQGSVYVGSADVTDITVTCSAPGTFRLAANLVEEAGVQAHTATLLPTGKVLLAGGLRFPTNAALASAELYDPATGVFTATGNLTAPRAGHTATLLSSGKVLLVGGWDVHGHRQHGRGACLSLCDATSEWRRAGGRRRDQRNATLPRKCGAL
jgi:hypothetical protein